MADVTGSISSLPGSRHKVPDNQTCDDCGAPAVVRIQGETDSMGSEMIDLCQTCADKIKAHVHEGSCDWCGNHAVLKPRRDSDEGRCGPVYHVCVPCIKKDNERLAEEYEESNSSDHFWDDCHGY